MKFFAVAIALALVAAAVAKNAGYNLTPEQEQHVETIKTACITETGANKEAVEALHNGDFSKVDDKLKCYSNCVQTKLGYFVNDVINEENIQKSLGPLFGEEQVKATQAKCNGIKGTDQCDTALEVYRCYTADRVAAQG